MNVLTWKVEDPWGLHVGSGLCEDHHHREREERPYPVWHAWIPGRCYPGWSQLGWWASYLFWTRVIVGKLTPHCRLCCLLLPLVAGSSEQQRLPSSLAELCGRPAASQQPCPLSWSSSSSRQLLVASMLLSHPLFASLRSGPSGGEQIVLLMCSHTSRSGVYSITHKYDLDPIWPCVDINQEVYVQLLWSAEAVWEYPRPSAIPPQHPWGTGAAGCPVQLGGAHPRHGDLVHCLHSWLHLHHQCREQDLPPHHCHFP